METVLAIIAIGTPLLVIAAYVAMRFYDAPLRRRLAKRKTASDGVHPCSGETR